MTGQGLRNETLTWAEKGGSSDTVPRKQIGFLVWFNSMLVPQVVLELFLEHKNIVFFSHSNRNIKECIV